MIQTKKDGNVVLKLESSEIPTSERIEAETEYLPKVLLTKQKVENDVVDATSEERESPDNFRSKRFLLKLESIQASKVL